MSFLAGKPSRRFPTSLSSFLLGGAEQSKYLLQKMKEFFLRIWKSIVNFLKRDEESPRDRNREVEGMSKQEMCDRIAEIIKKRK